MNELLLEPIFFPGLDSTFQCMLAVTEVPPCIFATNQFSKLHVIFLFPRVTWNWRHDRAPSSTNQLFGSFPHTKINSLHLPINFFFIIIVFFSNHNSLIDPGLNVKFEQNERNAHIIIHGEETRNQSIFRFHQFLERGTIFVSCKNYLKKKQDSIVNFTLQKT